MTTRCSAPRLFDWYSITFLLCQNRAVRGCWLQNAGDVVHAESGDEKAPSLLVRRIEEAANLAEITFTLAGESKAAAASTGKIEFDIRQPLSALKAALATKLGALCFTRLAAAP